MTNPTGHETLPSYLSRRTALPDDLHRRAVEIATEATGKFPMDAAAYISALGIAATERSAAAAPVYRIPLPLSTGTEKIKPGQIKKVLVRVQQALRPARLFVSDYKPPMPSIEFAPFPTTQSIPWWRRLWNALRGRGGGDDRLGLLAERMKLLADRVESAERANRPGSADWIIEDIVIRNRSQLTQAGALPGDMFSSGAIDSFLRLERARVGDDVSLIVRYIGPHKDGIPFTGSMICDVDDEVHPSELEGRSGATGATVPMQSE